MISPWGYFRPAPDVVLTSQDHVGSLAGDPVVGPVRGNLSAMAQDATHFQFHLVRNIHLKVDVLGGRSIVGPVGVGQRKINALGAEGHRPFHPETPGPGAVKEALGAVWRNTVDKMLGIGFGSDARWNASFVYS